MIQITMRSHQTGGTIKDMISMLTT